MAGAEQAYALQAELHGHTEDVRGLAPCDLGLITSSRDKTCKIWAKEGDAGYSEVATLVGHTEYVVPVAWVPPGRLPDLPNGAVLSGSKDTTAIVWDPTSASIVQRLAGGHKYAVTGVGLLPGGEVVTCSLDQTIKVWRAGHVVATLEGHEGPVLCLAVTPEGDLLTGSGDRTVRRWRDGQCVHVYRGHTDSVRGLAVLPGVGFVSASHDATLRVWAADGSVLAELVGHTALVYAVAASQDGSLLASGSEDNTVRVWQLSGECVQVLPHPGCVWDVAFLPGADLATACSDAVARVFSRDPARQADTATQAAFARVLEEHAAAASQKEAGAAGGGDGAAIPGLPPGVTVEEAAALLNPGNKDGATKIIREPDGSIAAYGWSAAASTWEKIGVVVDGPEAGSISGSIKVHAGREWDFVFDVAMEDGQPSAKLAMDRGENPWLVADRFLAENELPPSDFKEQVVQFIIANTEGGGRGPDTSAMPVTGGGCDPFTGGAQPAPSASGRELPARQCLLFDAPPPAEALARRVREFSAQLAAEPSMAGDALTEADLAPGGALERLLALLPAACSGTCGGAALAPDLLALLGRLLAWPADRLFPGLDVARCLALDPAGAEVLAAQAGTLAAPRSGGIALALAQAAVGAAGGPAAQQTGLRLLANCVKQPPLAAWLAGQQEALLDGFAGAGAGGKGVRLSLATLLLNLAVGAAQHQAAAAAAAEASMQLLSHLEELGKALPAGQGEEADAAHRTLLALGTLASGNPELASVARDLGLAGLAARYVGAPGQLGAVAAEVSQLLA